MSISTGAEFNSWLVKAIGEQMRLRKPPRSIAELKIALRDALPKHLAAHKRKISKAHIVEKFNEIFWKGRVNLVRDAVKAGYTPVQFREQLGKQLGDRPVPTEWIIAARFLDMKGHSKAPRELSADLPGILRVPLTEAPRYSLEETSYAKPFHALADSKSEQFSFALISAPQVGLAFDPDIVQNRVRCGISAARKSRCDALVISGGLLRLSWQKTTGPNRLLVDLVMGTELDVESMAESYRGRVLEIIEKGSFEPIFTTAVESFIDLLHGWYTLMMRPGKRPEFEGPVYVVLSPDELGLVRRMAYFELLYMQSRELREAEAKESVLAKLAAEALVHLSSVRHTGTRKEIAAAEQAYQDAENDFQMSSRQKHRLRMTHLNPFQNRRVYDQALSYLIHEIEKHLPNAKVIDQNSAFIRFGASEHIIKIVSGGDSNNPYYDELGSYGPTQRKGNLPSLTLVSHPRAVYPRKTSRENYLKGSMLGTVGFAEAPVLVDSNAILERTRGSRVPLPIVKAVSDPMFEGGMYIVTIDPVFGVTPEFIRSDAIARIAAPRRGPPAPPAKKIWLMVPTDPHFGGGMRLFLRRPSGLPIAVTEAVFEMLYSWGLNKNGITPIVGMFFCDDLLQGNHIDTHTKPHYNKRIYAKMLAESEQALKSLRAVRDPKQREELMRTMFLRSIDQVKHRPPDYLTGQFEELFHGLIRPYADVFRGTLLAAKQAGVVVSGVSDAQNTPEDTRDVGLINWGSGNHARKTTFGMLHEGVIVAENLRMRLSAEPQLAGMDLDRLIKAPLSQDQSTGYGKLRVGGGYEWGLHVCGTPPKRDSWKDVLHGWVAVNRQRGNPSTMLDGSAIVHITGDKHFFAGAFAGGDVYVMGSSSTHTDAFADIANGLPPNNAGIAFIGLPIDGPDAGVICVKHLTPTVLQHYLTTGIPFPWDEFLPDRV